MPRVTVLPVIERRILHGAKFSITIAQIQPGRVTAAQGATAALDSNEQPRAHLRVFNAQERLIAIAEAVVPRTYQPLVVLESAP
jgi:hypothetical protein